MIGKRLCCALLVSVGLFHAPGSWGAKEFQVPMATSPVIDKAGVLPEDIKVELDQSLKKLNNQTGTQIGILIVPDLAGLPIEQASIKVTDAWKLGKKGADRGVLLLIAIDERRLRIEVGRGLEGDLTDARSKQIIADVMTPFFREGDLAGGVVAGVQAIAAITDPTFDLSHIASERPSYRPNRQHRGGAAPLIWNIIGIVIIVVLIQVIDRSRMRRFRSGSGFTYWSGGGGGNWSGGGGSSGGGWSDGGGGFSGGGASGGW